MTSLRPEEFASDALGDDDEYADTVPAPAVATSLEQYVSEVRMRVAAKVECAA